MYLIILFFVIMSLVGQIQGTARVVNYAGLSHLDLKDVKVISISLVCQKEALEKRIQKDINQGIRKPDVLARSVERLEMYQKLNTYKIDVSNKTIEEVVKEIIKVGDEND